MLLNSISKELIDFERGRIIRQYEDCRNQRQIAIKQHFVLSTVNLVIFQLKTDQKEIVKPRSGRPGTTAR